MHVAAKSHFAKIRRVSEPSLRHRYAQACPIDVAGSLDRHRPQLAEVKLAKRRIKNGKLVPDSQ